MLAEKLLKNCCSLLLIETYIFNIVNKKQPLIVTSHIGVHPPSSSRVWCFRVSSCSCVAAASLDSQRPLLGIYGPGTHSETTHFSDLWDPSGSENQIILQDTSVLSQGRWRPRGIYGTYWWVSVPIMTAVLTWQVGVGGPSDQGNPHGRITGSPDILVLLHREERLGISNVHTDIVDRWQSWHRTWRLTDWQTWAFLFCFWPREMSVLGGGLLRTPETFKVIIPFLALNQYVVRLDRRQHVDTVTFSLKNQCRNRTGLLL